MVSLAGRIHEADRLGVGPMGRTIALPVIVAAAEVDEETAQVVIISAGEEKPSSLADQGGSASRVAHGEQRPDPADQDLAQQAAVTGRFGMAAGAFVRAARRLEPAGIEESLGPSAIGDGLKGRWALPALLDGVQERGREAIGEAGIGVKVGGEQIPQGRGLVQRRDPPDVAQLPLGGLLVRDR